MPDWLAESNPTLYFLLACAAIACFAVWWRTRKTKYALAGGAAVCVLAGLFLLHHFLESDREQIVRKTQEITAAINARDTDAAFRHVSANFQRPTRDRKGFRDWAESHLRSRNVTEVQVWGFEVRNASRAQRRGEVEFFFKVRGNWGESPPGLFARVTFTLDADGQWRVQSFDYFRSITESNSPLPVYGW